jgi:hypothetical protein
MTLTTAQLRRAWAPACRGPWARLSMHGRGKITVRASTVEAWKAVNACLIKHNYLTRQFDTGAFNCRPITGGSDWSLHAYGIGADFNWTTNPYGSRLITDMPRAMIRDILAIRTNNGKQVLGWGGNYDGNKDAMHVEVVCSPADLYTGINPATVPSTFKPNPTPKPKPKPPTALELEMIVKNSESGAVIALTETHVRNVNKNRDKYFAVAKFAGARIPEWSTDRINQWVEDYNLIQLPPA